MNNNCAVRIGARHTVYEAYGVGYIVKGIRYKV